MRDNIETQDLQHLRDTYIRALALSDNSTLKARELAEDLFALDLTIYSQSYCFNSMLYNSFSRSHLDDTINLHPEQISILHEIETKDALIISAPTSFGKTFCIFEYICRKQPRNIVLIVPTLALVDEYLKKIIKKYNTTFEPYKIHTNLNENMSYNFFSGNIFILTHDRVVHESSYSLIKDIDFLVIDEVYKLEKDTLNDRVLILNLAYYHLAKLAKKYVLLAPFLNDIEDRGNLDKNPVFYKSMFSPVVNEVITVDVLTDRDRNAETKRLLSRLSPEEKTLVYFPTVSATYIFVNEIGSKDPLVLQLDDDVRQFLEWARDEIHEEWYLVKAMEHGYLVHNGQLPLGTRLFQMDLYEHSELYTKMLCTSTLLEGVNTTAKNIIITKPSRTGQRERNEAEPFSAFDFYNLVGRTGRLHQHYLGTAYYLKGPRDRPYKKVDAIRNIKFELTDDSQDMDIQRGQIDKHSDYKLFLSKLNTTHEEYILRTGGRLRFQTVNSIHESYSQYKNDLLHELHAYLTVIHRGRFPLVRILYLIIERNKRKLEPSIITGLLNLNRLKTRVIIENTLQYFGRQYSIDHIITTAIRLKTSYIQYDFHTKVLLIKYFLEKDEVKDDLISILDQKVISAIEKMYFTSSKQRKMLIDLGLFEGDINEIIRIIGDDFEDASELRRRLKASFRRMERVSFVSRYVIKNIL